jgi:hypothetical protein
MGASWWLGILLNYRRTLRIVGGLRNRAQTLEAMASSTVKECEFVKVRSTSAN